MPEQRSAGTRFRDFWQAIRDHFGARKRLNRVVDPQGLRVFLETRASHVTQTGLYGYLRTRAGARYPELFANDEFVRSINIAKWYIWLACLSDLAIYAGGLVAHRCGTGGSEVTRLMITVVDAALNETGVPSDSGEEFTAVAQRVRSRVELCDWSSVTDDEGPFVESPAALIGRAPIIEDLKRLDDEIVRNSMRFRWQEVRRDLRANLDAAALIASVSASRADHGSTGESA